MAIHRIKQLIITLLVAYLGFVSSDIFWQYYAPQERAIPVQITNTLNSNTTLPNGLFGTEKKAVAKKPTYSKVQNTKLDVTLIGIIKKQQEPLAIIKFANNQVQVFKVGESIRGIATLKAVENSFVILRYNGKDEKLTIQRSVDNSILAQNAQAATNQTTSSSNAFKAPIDNTSQEVSISSTEKQTLKRYLKQARANPANLLSVIQVEPFFNNGALGGFKVFPGRESHLFNTLGLKSGDIITEINGITLDSLSGAFKLGKDLASETEFNVNITRDGNAQTIYFNLN